MRLPGYLTSVVLAAVAAAPAGANEQALVEGVVAVRGAGTVTCGTDAYCTGTALVDVVLLGPAHLPRAAAAATVTLWLDNRAFRPHVSFSVDLDAENRIDAVVQNADCYAYGPDASSGPGPGTYVLSRAAGPSPDPYPVDVTFACTAVLIEHIL